MVSSQASLSRPFGTELKFGERKGEGLGWVSITLNYLLPRHRVCPAAPFFAREQKYRDGQYKARPRAWYGCRCCKSDVASALTIAAPARWRRWSGFLKPPQR